VADVALLVIHHLPDDPPTGETRWLYTDEGELEWNSGGDERWHRRVDTYGDPWEAYPTWWSELPSLPYDPSERLTTDDVRTVLRWLPSRDQMGKRDADAEDRLRAALPGEEGT
jgi:hypothetical protein